MLTAAILVFAFSKMLMAPRDGSPTVLDIFQIIDPQIPFMRERLRLCLVSPQNARSSPSIEANG